MKQTLLPALLPVLALALTLSAAPAALAQDNTSVHNKTIPSDPPAEEAPAAEAPAEEAPAAEAPAAEQPAQADAASTAEEQEPAAGAQTEAQPGQESNPFGVTDGWDTQFNTTPPASSQFTGAPDQAAIVEKVNAYFNTMSNLEGRFLQTDANDERKRGKFYLERPGKVLFDYARPSRMKIISNGEYLAIENHDLRTSDRYPLDSTPFRLLLKDKVDLAQDARIVAIDLGESIVVLTVEDKEGRGGQIRLFFDYPELQLREWIITDAQGLNTRIELGELENDKPADPKLFKFSADIGLPQFRGGGN